MKLEQKNSLPTSQETRTLAKNSEQNDNEGEIYG
jgi:hypothetical protein